jgi:hypothetical protein
VYLVCIYCLYMYLYVYVYIVYILVCCTKKNLATQHGSRLVAMKANSVLINYQNLNLLKFIFNKRPHRYNKN